jgi:hypothetical protein
MMATQAKLGLQLIVASIQARSTISIQEKIIVEFHSEGELDGCKLIVDLFLNPYLEGVEYIRNISCNKL